MTGGLKTTGAMVDALSSVDGIGLARPITQEPALPNKILKGEVKGAIEQIFDQNDFGLTNVVAGTQIRQVGRDQTPLDGSKKEDVEAFQEDMKAWSDAMGKDEKFEKFGYVDTPTLKAVPYGTA